MPVPCARCSMPLLKWELLRGNDADCPSCGAHNQVRLFPAAVARAAAPQAETALEGEAACFDHPAKRAVAVCQHCGRFVCQLCAIVIGDGVSCPSCVVKPQAKKRQANSGNSVMLYDTWTLTLPFALLVFWPLTVLSAPAALALTVMKWKQPLSLVRRNRWRFVVGLGLSLAQGGLWIWFFFYLVAKIRAGA
jgi:DNA-directed RNA polymerase subunit RPC12/RpoP